MSKSYDWVSSRSAEHAKAARERIGKVANQEQADRIALGLYDQRKVLEGQIKALDSQVEDLIEDTRAILEQYPLTRFYRSKN
jgi:hypothetical protein